MEKDYAAGNGPWAGRVVEEPDSNEPFKGAVMNLERICTAHKQALDYLLRLKNSEGFWDSKLSSSALSTSVAIAALASANTELYGYYIERGVGWLEKTQQPDGGWGDTPESPSNLSTTLLTLSALLISKYSESASMMISARKYIAVNAGTDSHTIAKAITRKYGEDRTFAVPILAVCALAGLVDWSEVPSLPFELSLLPGSMYRLVKLQVVSYALPALIAVGLLIAVKGNRVGAIRKMLIPKLLDKLKALQPESGGYLEAAPLTGFVAISLNASGLSDSVAMKKCIEFLISTVREDGSWPIDTNLSLWTTTNAVSALQSSNVTSDDTIKWITDLQYRHIHPFAGAKPGGWGWTYLSGSVPDADDTSGAIRILAGSDVGEAISKGICWLFDMQNSDGGWPTFCRGWGKLPFDQSSPDITAHALRAIHSAKEHIDWNKAKSSTKLGLKYLMKNQRADGSWVPLWFGCQEAADHRNPVYGTGRVLQALSEVGDFSIAGSGVEYLLDAANSDGGWGGAKGCQSTIEETSVAIMGLSGYTQDRSVLQAVVCGMEYLASRVEDGTWTKTSPLGLYFASLWYSEELYPVIWTVEALSAGIAVINKSRIPDMLQ